MKVSVCYTIVKEVVVDVDDKFKMMTDEYYLPSYLKTLQDKFLETLYTVDEIPDDCDIISVFDDDTGDIMYES